MNKTRKAGYAVAAVGYLGGFFLVVALGQLSAGLGCIIGAYVVGKWASGGKPSPKPAPATATDQNSFSANLVVPHNELPKGKIISPPEELDREFEALMRPGKEDDLLDNTTPRLLMTGPSGVGMTTCTRNAALRYGGNLVEISNKHLAGALLTKADQLLATRLEQVKKLAIQAEAPTVLLLDNLDLLSGCQATDRASLLRTERGVLDVLVTFLKDAAQQRYGRLIVIACTSKPDDVDSDLRSHFDVPIALTLPDLSSRHAYLSDRFAQEKSITPDELTEFAKQTASFSFRELATLTSQAARCARGEGASTVTSVHFWKAKRAWVRASDDKLPLDMIVPLDKLESEQLVNSPPEVGANLARIFKPNDYARLTLGAGNTLLLLGPPGTGKTASIRAATLKLEANLVMIAPAAIKSDRYGQTEKALKRALDGVTALASTSDKPTILFIDEIDLFLPDRSRRWFSHAVDDAIFGMFLEFMDGIFGKTKINSLAIAASTNNPEGLDPAILSRFSTTVQFNWPEKEARRAAIAGHLAKVDHDTLSDELIDWLAKVTPTYDFRELRNLVNDAGLRAVQAGCMVIKEEHIKAAHRAKSMQKEKLLADKQQRFGLREVS